MIRLNLLALLALSYSLTVLKAESASSNAGTEAGMASSTNLLPRFEVRGFKIAGQTPPSSNFLSSTASKYLGTNVSLVELGRAASELQEDYLGAGFSNVVVAVAADRITCGIVPINVFRGRTPQVFVSGRRYPDAFVTPLVATNLLAEARTNPAPKITIRAYEIRGDTLLSEEALTDILLKYTGTNMTVADILKAASDLQGEYLRRGFPTVRVTVPQQQIAEGIVKFRVFQGRLTEVLVENNRFFTSNNVMRALPSLKTNIILNANLFQAELNRANANRDRQIYPELRPGPETNTSSLVLTVKDRLPLHGRLELNNANTPGTPELRLNSSLLYNNLWQLEHSIGFQYGFSPEAYKQGDQWSFYDRPLIANYSAFYRMPVGEPESMAATVAGRPGEFGDNEATRQFRLPPSSGVPELNLFVSRSTVDTDVEQGEPVRLFTSPTRTIDRVDTHQDITVNSDLGVRLTEPLPEFAKVRSGISAGFDFKKYSISSYATNYFIFTEYLLDEQGNPLPPRPSSIPSPVPTSLQALTYLPLSLRWDASRQDKNGNTAFGLSYSPNLWFSPSEAEVQRIAGSSQATGFWNILAGNLSREQKLYQEWKLYARADGQWSSQPLISNEQYGLGGLAGVRGYHEGEIFGDLGWRIITEVRSPTLSLGRAFEKYPMFLRGVLFMDYGQAFLLDPQGRQGITDLWGTGVGAALSFGSHFDARVAAAWPLLSAGTVTAGEARIYFGLGGQF